MSTGVDREAVGEVWYREHWRGRHVCGAGRCQRIDPPRCARSEVAIQMRDHDLSRARYHQAHIKGSILRTTLGPGHNSVRERVAETASRAASSSSQFALG